MICNTSCITFLEVISVGSKMISIRLTDEEWLKLSYLSQKRAISKSELIRMAIERLDSDKIENSDDVLSQLLLEQIKIKDQQIDVLTTSLLRSQEALNQAHLLNAADKEKLLFNGIDKNKGVGIIKRIFNRSHNN